MVRLWGALLVGLLFGAPVFAQARTVSLEWDANTEEDLAGYNIYRSETAGGAAYTKINPAAITATTYDDTKALAGRTYYYAATALDTAGQESGYSNEVVYLVPHPTCQPLPEYLTIQPDGFKAKEKGHLGGAPFPVMRKALLRFTEDRRNAFSVYGICLIHFGLFLPRPLH